jgi:hypothetical protein
MTFLAMLQETIPLGDEGLSVLYPHFGGFRESHLVIGGFSFDQGGSTDVGDWLGFTSRLKKVRYHERGD